MKLSEDFRSCVRLFAYYYHNGSLPIVTGESGLLEIPDYREELLNEPSIMEMVFAIYSNNIDIDKKGKVLNHSHAMKRAAQFIRSACDMDYKPNPEFEDWEMELH